MGGRLRSPDVLTPRDGGRLPRKYRKDPIDLSDVYDFAPPGGSCEFRGGRGAGDAQRALSGLSAGPSRAAPRPLEGFTLPRHPGLVVVPGALSESEQVRSDLPEPRRARGHALRQAARGA